MQTNISKIDLEEITNKLKGIDFLVNGMMYLNNYDEDSYSSGVLMVSDTIRNVIEDVKKLENVI